MHTHWVSLSRTVRVAASVVGAAVLHRHPSAHQAAMPVETVVMAVAWCVGLLETSMLPLPDAGMRAPERMPTKLYSYG